MKKRTLSDLPGKLLVFLYAIFLLSPMYVIIVTALKTPEEVNINPLGLPKRIAFENFYNAIVKGEILKYGWNSLIVTCISVVLIILLNTLCAYGIYKIFNKKLGAFIYSVIILGMMVPTVGYVPIILLYRQVHLYNNLAGLIVAAVAASVPFAIFILVGFLRSVPKELEEAATIDGCTDLQILRYVLVPVIMPALVTIGIFNLITSWNNLFQPLLLIRDKALYTIPIGLLNFRGTHSTEYSLLFAAVFIVSAPILIIYFKFQKKFVESLSGSVKA